MRDAESRTAVHFLSDRTRSIRFYRRMARRTTFTGGEKRRKAERDAAYLHLSAAIAAWRAFSLWAYAEGFVVKSMKGVMNHAKWSAYWHREGSPSREGRTSN